MSDFHSDRERLADLEKRCATLESSLAAAVRDIEILKAQMSEKRDTDVMLFDRGAR